MMRDNGYGLSDGAIFKKVPEAHFSYVYCCSVKEYLLSSLGNVAVADMLAGQIGTLTGLLSEPSCRLIVPTEIDYNFIEVLNGYCFDIAGKRFVYHPNSLKGSPRAFVKYKYVPGVVPNPQRFIEGEHCYSGIQNSLLIISVC